MSYLILSDIVKTTGIDAPRLLEMERQGFLVCSHKKNGVKFYDDSVLKTFDSLHGKYLRYTSGELVSASQLARTTGKPEGTIELMEKNGFIPPPVRVNDLKLYDKVLCINSIKENYETFEKYIEEHYTSEGVLSAEDEPSFENIGREQTVVADEEQEGVDTRDIEVSDISEETDVPETDENDEKSTRGQRRGANLRGEARGKQQDEEAARRRAADEKNSKNNISAQGDAAPEPEGKHFYVYRENPDSDGRSLVGQVQSDGTGAVKMNGLSPGFYSISEYNEKTGEIIPNGMEKDFTVFHSMPEKMIQGSVAVTVSQSKRAESYEGRMREEQQNIEYDEARISSEQADKQAFERAKRDKAEMDRKIAESYKASMGLRGVDYSGKGQHHSDLDSEKIDVSVNVYYESPARQQSKVVDRSTAARRDAYEISREDALRLVNIDPRNLRYIKNQTSEICDTAIKSNGNAVVFVKNKTPEYCSRAISEGGFNLKIPSIYSEASKVTSDITRFIPEKQYRRIVEGYIKTDEIASKTTTYDEPVKGEPEYQVKLTKYGSEMQKQDNTREVVNGANYSLYKRNEDGSNSLVTSGLSTDESGNLYVKGLAEGNYYFKETISSTGYTLSKEKTEFHIGTDGARDRGLDVESYGTRQKFNTSIKVDNPTAKYDIYDKNNNPVLRNVASNSTGRISLNNVPWGEYELREVSHGNKKDGGGSVYTSTSGEISSKKFAIEKTTKRTTFITGEHRRDESSHEYIPKYIYNAKTNVKEYANVSEGASALVQGKAQPSSGISKYTKNADGSRHVPVSSGVMSPEITLNRQPPSIVLTKTEKSPGTLEPAKIQGAKYNLVSIEKDGSRNVIQRDLSTDSGGKLSLSGLRAGSYVLEESSPASGYEKQREAIQFNLTEQQVKAKSTLSINDASTKAIAGSVMIGRAKSSASIYNIYDDQGNLVKRGVRPDTEGNIKTNDLRWGNYFVTEINKSKNGMVSEGRRFGVNISPDSKTSSVTYSLTPERTHPRFARGIDVQGREGVAGVNHFNENTTRDKRVSDDTTFTGPSERAQSRSTYDNNLGKRSGVTASGRLGENAPQKKGAFDSTRAQTSEGVNSRLAPDKTNVKGSGTNATSEQGTLGTPKNNKSQRYQVVSEGNRSGTTVPSGTKTSKEARPQTSHNAAGTVSGGVGSQRQKIKITGTKKQSRQIAANGRVKVIGNGSVISEPKAQKSAVQVTTRPINRTKKIGNGYYIPNKENAGLASGGTGSVGMNATKLKTYNALKRPPRPNVAMGQKIHARSVRGNQRYLIRGTDRTDALRNSTVLGTSRHYVNKPEVALGSKKVNEQTTFGSSVLPNNRTAKNYEKALKSFKKPRNLPMGVSKTLGGYVARNLKMRETEAGEAYYTIKSYVNWAPAMLLAYGARANANLSVEKVKSYFFNNSSYGSGYIKAFRSADLLKDGEVFRFEDFTQMRTMRSTLNERAFKSGLGNISELSEAQITERIGALTKKLGVTKNAADKELISQQIDVLKLRSLLNNVEGFKTLAVTELFFKAGLIKNMGVRFDLTNPLDIAKMKNLIDKFSVSAGFGPFSQMKVSAIKKLMSSGRLDATQLKFANLSIMLKNLELANTNGLNASGKTGFSYTMLFQNLFGGSDAFDGGMMIVRTTKNAKSALRAAINLRRGLAKIDARIAHKLGIKSQSELLANAIKGAKTSAAQSNAIKSLANTRLGVNGKKVADGAKGAAAQARKIAQNGGVKSSVRKAIYSQLQKTKFYKTFEAAFKTAEKAAAGLGKLSVVASQVAIYALVAVGTFILTVCAISALLTVFQLTTNAMVGFFEKDIDDPTGTTSVTMSAYSALLQRDEDWYADIQGLYGKKVDEVFAGGILGFLDPNEWDRHSIKHFGPVDDDGNPLLFNANGDPVIGFSINYLDGSGNETLVMSNVKDILSCGSAFIQNDFSKYRPIYKAYVGVESGGLWQLTHNYVTTNSEIYSCDCGCDEFTYHCNDATEFFDGSTAFGYATAGTPDGQSIYHWANTGWSGQPMLRVINGDVDDPSVTTHLVGANGGTAPNPKGCSQCAAKTYCGGGCANSTTIYCGGYHGGNPCSGHSVCQGHLTRVNKYGITVNCTNCAITSAEQKTVSFPCEGCVETTHCEYVLPHHYELITSTIYYHVDDFDVFSTTETGRANFIGAGSRCNNRMTVWVGGRSYYVCGGHVGVIPPGGGTTPVICNNSKNEGEDITIRFKVTSGGVTEYKVATIKKAVCPGHDGDSSYRNTYGIVRYCERGGTHTTTINTYECMGHCDGHTAKLCLGHTDLHVDAVVNFIEDEKPATKPDGMDNATYALVAPFLGNTFDRDYSTTLSLGYHDDSSDAPIMTPEIGGKKMAWYGWTNFNRDWAKKLLNDDWKMLYDLNMVEAYGTKFSEAEVQAIISDTVPDTTSETRKKICTYAVESVGRVPYYINGFALYRGYTGNMFGMNVPDDGAGEGRTHKGLDYPNWVSWVYYGVTRENTFRLCARGNPASESLDGLKDAGRTLVFSAIQPGDVVIKGDHAGIYIGINSDGKCVVVSENAIAANVVVSTYDVADFESSWSRRLNCLGD